MEGRGGEGGGTLTFSKFCQEEIIKLWKLLAASNKKKTALQLFADVKILLIWLVYTVHLDLVRT